MAVTYQRLAGEPITIITVTGSMEDGLLMPGPDNMDHALMEIMGETLGKDYLIIDLTGIQLSLNEMAMMLSHVRGELRRIGGKKFLNTNVTHIFVGSSEAVETGVRALKQQQYGQLNTFLFKTLDEALAFARKQLKHRK